MGLLHEKGRVYTSAVGRERGGRLWSYRNITGEAVEWKGAERGRSYVRVLDICIFLQLQCKISIARFFGVMYIPNCRKTKSSTHLVLKLVFNHFNAFFFDHHAVLVNWGSMCACESFVSFKNDNAD